MALQMTILFVGKKSRITRHQLPLIYLRVTVNGERFEVTTHRYVEPSEWSSSASRVKARPESAISAYPN